MGVLGADLPVPMGGSFCTIPCHSLLFEGALAGSMKLSNVGEGERSKEC